MIVKKENKLISVIVPIYNSEEFLEECLESLINQTYSNLEIILINDGSTDNSYFLCEQYKKQDKRIILLTSENYGVGHARNTGIEIVQGEYVVFSDSDDIWIHDGIENLYKIAQKNEFKPDIVIGSFLYFDHLLNTERKQTFLKKEKYSMKEFLDKLSEGTIDAFFGSQCNKLYRINILRKCRFREDTTFAEDFRFNLDFFKKVNNVFYCDKIVYKYRITVVGSLTKEKRNPLCLWKEYKELYKLMLDLFSKNQCLEENKNKLNLFLLKGINATANITMKEEVLKHVQYVFNDDIFKTIFFKVSKLNLKEKIIYYCLKNKRCKTYVFFVNFKNIIMRR